MAENETDTELDEGLEESEVEEEETPEQVDEGLEALADKHGWAKVMDALGRLSKKT